MRILITNDDGISAPGLQVLTEIAHQVAGPEGEVWTVAPAFEQSGVGHCISYSHPTLISKLEDRRFAAEGSPADCVLAGLYDVLVDTPPDLILSGVNRGNNSAENTVYSGTIGGAMEGALQGLKSIALSQFYGPGNIELEDTFESSREHGAEVVKALLNHGFPTSAEYQTFYNVNFPPCSAADTQGMKVVRQGYRKKAKFAMEAQLSPSGRRFLWIKGGAQNEHTGADTDAGANVDGFISVTPMKADLTDHAALPDLAKALRP